MDERVFIRLGDTVSVKGIKMLEEIIRDECLRRFEEIMVSTNNTRTCWIAFFYFYQNTLFIFNTKPTVTKQIIDSQI